MNRSIQRENILDVSDLAEWPVGGPGARLAVPRPDRPHRALDGAAPMADLVAARKAA